MKFAKVLACLIIVAFLGMAYAKAEELDRSQPMSKSEQELQKTAKLTYEEAKTIALKKEPGKVFNWELENEDGHLIYTIQIQLPNDKKYSREVNVDAMTGKIVADEKEDLATQLSKAKKSS